jgi:hypothetical protein
MSHKGLLLCTLVLATGGQAVLLADLVGAQDLLESTSVWLLAQVALSVITAVCGGQLLGASASAMPFYLLLFGFSLLIPVAGSMGSLAALAFATRQARLAHREPDYWTVTQRTELPFTTPSGRLLTRVDSRGYTEHLLYSRNHDDLYRKVLAAGNIKVSLSVAALKEAMRHGDERIRLTAYKTLDKKVTDLNLQIQLLEAQVSSGDTRESSNIWLQIASNYWELLTLEESEPVARRQLLDKASQAAIQAVSALPINRNAHFLLGRVSLLQGDTRRARVAFERAQALGMPTDKVVPYLAEAAFMRHDFKRVRKLVQQLDPAILAYPPLSHVAQYWT